MKKLCAAAHRKIFGKDYYIIESLAYKKGTLSFHCPKYRPMPVHFVEYGIQSKVLPETLKEYSIVAENERWYVTQGRRSGCVCASVLQFKLEKHVCGRRHNKFI